MYSGAVLRRLRHPTSGKQKQPEHCKPAHPPPNNEVFVSFGLLIILHVTHHILFDGSTAIRACAPALAAKHFHLSCLGLYKPPFLALMIVQFVSP